MMPGMNAPFDIAADQKRAETLKSLALEAVPLDIPKPKPILRRLALPACFFALISGGIFYWPEVVRHVEAVVGNRERATAEPVTAAQNQSDPLAAQFPLRAPAPAVREVTGSGFVVAPRLTAVFAKYEGRITKIAVEPGDIVQAGQILVTLEDAGSRFALEQANLSKPQADLVLAAREIDLAHARTLLGRAETLAARGATSKQALDDARTAMERAANAVAQARQSVDNAGLAIRIAEERVAELAVRAPFAGTVTRLDAHVGDMVLARLDSVLERQSLLTLTDTKSLVIDADVAETTIAALKPDLRGQAVLDGFPDQPFTVTVMRLAPVVSAEKGTIALRLSLEGPPAGIRPNMAVRIRITLDEAGDRTQ
jgi:RND family efflux transporter MFP subunit